VKRILFLLVALLFSSLLFAGKFWKEKPYTEWKEKEALKLLNDSPWAKAHVTRSFTGSTVIYDEQGAQDPNPGVTRAPMQPPLTGPEILQWGSRRKYFVRFLSAAPVRQATARLHMLKSNWSEEQVRQFLQTKPFGDMIAISLFVEAPQNQQKFELDHLTTERLRQDTYLHLKKSKVKVHLEEYIPPARDEGRLEAVLLFPRVKDEVLLAEKDLRFNCKIFFGHDPRAADASLETEVKLKFKLKDMVFEGKLEL
jgi:hypothetical protein